MPIVVNATEETITTRLCGNWFTFKPGAQKTMSQELAHFISTERSDSGLAVLPDRPDNVDSDVEITESELKSKTAEWETAKAAAVEAARNAYIARLRRVIYNNQVSLRQDLDRGNIKADAAAFITDGELEAMRLVAKYDRKGKDAEQAKIEEVKKLMEQIKK